MYKHSILSFILKEQTLFRPHISSRYRYFSPGLLINFLNCILLVTPLPQLKLSPKPLKTEFCLHHYNKLALFKDTSNLHLAKSNGSVLSLILLNIQQYKEQVIISLSSSIFFTWLQDAIFSWFSSNLLTVPFHSPLLVPPHLGHLNIIMP